jgi:hypothetical protein
MSHLADNPEKMIEVIALLVKRLGGNIILNDDDWESGPCLLVSEWDGEHLTLTIEKAEGTLN